MLFRNVERVWPSQGENKAWNQIGSNLAPSIPSKNSKNWTPYKIWTPSFSNSPPPALNFLSRPFTQLCFLPIWKGCTWAAIRLVFPMVELSMEVIEGLRDPLIGLRCWISRCTCHKTVKRCTYHKKSLNTQRLQNLPEQFNKSSSKASNSRHKLTELTTAAAAATVVAL